MAFATARPDAPIAPGTARLVPGDAAVTVHRGSLTAAEDAPLRSGDSLTVESGIAIIETAKGRLFARPGTALTFDGLIPRITKGDLLIDGKKLTIATEAAKVFVDGLGRVRQGLSTEASVYNGTAKVNTVADTLKVPALRRVVVAGTGAATLDATLPLVLSNTDSWDRRFMGPALELDSALTSRSRGLTMQFADASEMLRDQVISQAAGYEDLTVLAAHHAVGEVVVAAELARATKETAVFATSLAERAEGASWGLIAYAQGVRELPDTLPGIYETAVPVVTQVPVVTTTTVPVPTQNKNIRIPQPTTPPAPVDPDLPSTTPTTQAAPVVVNPLGPVVSGLGSILNGLLGG